MTSVDQECSLDGKSEVKDDGTNKTEKTGPSPQLRRASSTTGKTPPPIPRRQSEKCMVVRTPPAVESPQRPKTPPWTAPMQRRQSMPNAPDSGPSKTAPNRPPRGVLKNMRTKSLDVLEEEKTVVQPKPSLLVGSETKHSYSSVNSKPNNPPQADKSVPRDVLNSRPKADEPNNDNIKDNKVHSRSNVGGSESQESKTNENATKMAEKVAETKSKPNDSNEKDSGGLPDLDLGKNELKPENDKLITEPASKLLEAKDSRKPVDPPASNMQKPSVKDSPKPVDPPASIMQKPSVKDSPKPVDPPASNKQKPAAEGSSKPVDSSISKAKPVDTPSTAQTSQKPQTSQKESQKPVNQTSLKLANNEAEPSQTPDTAKQVNNEAKVCSNPEASGSNNLKNDMGFVKDDKAAVKLSNKVENEANRPENKRLKDGSSDKSRKQDNVELVDKPQKDADSSSKATKLSDRWGVLRANEQTSRPDRSSTTVLNIAPVPSAAKSLASPTSFFSDAVTKFIGYNNSQSDSSKDTKNEVATPAAASPVTNGDSDKKSGLWPVALEDIKLSLPAAPSILTSLVSSTTAADSSASDQMLNGKNSTLSPEGGLSVTSVDSRNFLAEVAEEYTAEALEAQLRKAKRFHKRNLVIEGSCNYFFWMEKIAMVCFTSHYNLRRLLRSTKITGNTYFKHFAFSPKIFVSFSTKKLGGGDILVKIKAEN